MAQILKEHLIWRLSSRSLRSKKDDRDYLGPPWLNTNRGYAKKKLELNRFAWKSSPLKLYFMHSPGDKSSALRECQSRSGVLNSRVTGLSWHPMLKYFLAFNPKQTIVSAAYLNSLMLFFRKKRQSRSSKTRWKYKSCVIFLPSIGKVFRK